MDPVDESVLSLSSLSFSSKSGPSPLKKSTPLKSVQRKKKRKKDAYICDFCGTILNTRYGMKLHRNTHMNNYKYKCPLCSKGFHHSWHYQGHINRHHGTKPYKCQLCNASFSYQKDLRRHKDTCKMDPSPQTHTCRKCSHKTTSKAALLQHARAEHGGQVYICPVCSKAFKWRSSLAYHKKHVCVNNWLVLWRPCWCQRNFTKWILREM